MSMNRLPHCQRQTWAGGVSFKPSSLMIWQAPSNSRIQTAAVAAQLAPAPVTEVPLTLQTIDTPQPQPYQYQEPQQLQPSIHRVLRLPHSVTAVKSRGARPSAMRRARHSPQRSIPQQEPTLQGSQELNLTEEDCCSVIQQAASVTPQNQSKLMLALVSSAQQCLLSLHKRYILYQAKRFKAALGQAGEAAGHELYMAGVLGLMQAARRWTPHMRGKAKTFLTFAHHYIRLNMMATYRELQSSHVYIPRYLEDIRQRVLKSARVLRAQEAAGGPPVTAAAIAAHAGVSKKAVLDLASAVSQTSVVLDMEERGEEAGAALGVRREAGVVSIDQVAAEEPLALGILDDLPGGRSGLSGAGAVQQRSEALIHATLLDARLKELLGQVLTQREQEVLEALAVPGATVTTVAQQIGLSHQRVSQLQSKAQQKLERACEVGGSELRAGLEELCTALED